MKFPNLVYKCPGPHFCEGGTYDYRQVKNAEELTDFIDKGWFPTLDLAKNPNEEAVIKFIEDMEFEVEEDDTGINPVDDSENETASRDELILKAKQLGIVFTSHTSNETLLARIQAAQSRE